MRGSPSARPGRHCSYGTDGIDGSQTGKMQQSHVFVALTMGRIITRCLILSTVLSRGPHDTASPIPGWMASNTTESRFPTPADASGARGVPQVVPRAREPTNLLERTKRQESA